MGGGGALDIDNANEKLELGKLQLKMNIALLIKNAIALICFTVLAVFFCKWWIVLFAGFFISYQSSK